MSRLADDLCAEIRAQCDAAENFKRLWMQANDELERSRNAERAWEIAMMKSVGEDGVVSVVDAINTIKQQRDKLLTGLERLRHAYVNLLETGRDRIIDLGGDCDPVDVMEESDLNLREVRDLIAKAKAGAL